MDTVQTVARIKETAKIKGYKMKWLCQNLGVRDNYFTDAKNKHMNIPDNIIQQVAVMLQTSVEYLKGESDDPNFRIESVGLKTMPYEPTTQKPIYGQASAGLGVIADQQALGYASVMPQHNGNEYFWLEVYGDSMSPMIDDGDLVLVKQDHPIESGAIMVVILDGIEGFVKKVAIDEDTIWLHSVNPYYPPMSFCGSELNRLRFVGKVVEQRRMFR